MARYRHNLARHVLGVARHCQAGIMHLLQSHHGHSQLRLGFEPYISLLARGDRRLSELADALGITRQAANQVIDLIESAGYIERTPDPADGRAKRVQLTRKGRDLQAELWDHSAKLRQALAESVPVRHRKAFADKLNRIVAAMQSVRAEYESEGDV